MDYKQYKQIKQDIENEYKKNLEALEIVWKRAQGMGSGAVHSSTENGGSDVGTSDAVRSVISGLGEIEFDVDAVVEALNAHSMFQSQKIKRLSINNTLHRLMRRGELEVVKKGQGRMSSIYKKKIQQVQ